LQNAVAIGCIIVDPVADTVVAASSDRRRTNCLDHAAMLCIGSVAEQQRLAQVLAVGNTTVIT